MIILSWITKIKHRTNGIWGHVRYNVLGAEQRPAVEEHNVRRPEEYEQQHHDSLHSLLDERIERRAAAESYVFFLAATLVLPANQWNCMTNWRIPHRIEHHRGVTTCHTTGDGWFVCTGSMRRQQCPVWLLIRLTNHNNPHVDGVSMVSVLVLRWGDGAWWWRGWGGAGGTMAAMNTEHAR
jgi:hypothetical protein